MIINKFTYLAILTAVNSDSRGVLHFLVYLYGFRNLRLYRLLWALYVVSAFSALIQRLGNAWQYSLLARSERVSGVFEISSGVSIA